MFDIIVISTCNLFFINRPIPFYDGEREDFETCYKPMDAAQYTLSMMFANMQI